MKCKYCGIEMQDESPNSSIVYYTHPGGPCARQTTTVGPVDFTRAELLALKRVAQAQLERETRRGRNG